MLIKQVAFEIPAEILPRLLAGEYNRFGGVVRDSAGHIVIHLKEVQVPEQAVGVLGKALNAIKNPKTIILIGIGVVVVGGIAYFVGKSKGAKSVDMPEVPQCAANYNNALCAYFEAIRNAKLDLGIVNALISSLDEIKEEYAEGLISIDFSAEQIETLVNLIFDYTHKLAEANDFGFDEQKEPMLVKPESAVVGLRHCLELQKQILKPAG